MKHARTYAKHAGAALYSLLLAIPLLLDSPLNFLTNFGEPGTDSSVFRTVALYMDRGYMPYKDTFDHKGPLIYLYNWLGMQISYWRGIWIIELVSMAATLFLLYQIARKVSGPVLSALAAAAAGASLYALFSGGNFTEEYAMPFIAGGLLIFIDYFENRVITRRRLFLCGFCFGAVCMLRVNMAGIWVVFCIAVLIRALKEKQTAAVIPGFLLWFLCGAGAVILPFVIWLAAGGALTAFFECYINFNLLYSSVSEHAAAKDRLDAFYFILSYRSIALGFLLSLFSAFTKRDWTRIGYAIAFVLVFALTAMAGRPYRHYLLAIVPMLVFPYAELFRGITSQKPGPLTVAAVYLAYLIFFMTWQSCLNAAVNVVSHSNEQTAWSEPTASVCSYVLDHTEEADRIAVLGNWDNIYTITGRLCASRYSYLYPIAAIDGKVYEQYYADLAETKPALIILPETVKPDSQFRDFIKKYQYRKAASFGEIRIYSAQTAPRS